MEKREEWVILELMGHRVLAGRLTEVERAGAKFLRIEVPLGPPPQDGTPERFFVQDYQPSSVYGITPVPETVARDKARFYRPVNVAALLGPGAVTTDEPAPGSPADELRRERVGQAMERERLEGEDMEDLPPPRPPPMYECEESCEVTADAPEEAQAHSDSTGHTMERVLGMNLVNGPLPPQIIAPRQASEPVPVATSTTGPDDPPPAS